MDIWNWVYPRLQSIYEDDPALARNISNISSWAVDGDHQRVDATLPGVVAQLRARGDVWLEVFARHWGLQSRILHRRDARDSALQDAVDLVERASREDARDCPQSVCVVQDLCSAYGIVDGVGYGESRVQVADETLARIDPNWPCWRCINAEKASALMDLGRVDEALEVCEQVGMGDHEIGGTHVDALLRLNRLDDALEVAVAIDVSASGESGALSKRLDIAEVQAHRGDLEACLEHLPTAAELKQEVEHFEQFLAVRAHLVREHQQEFTIDLVEQGERMLRQIALHGGHRDTVDVGCRWATLLLEQGHWAMSHWTAERAEAAIPRLVASLGASEKVAELQQAIAAARPSPAVSTEAALDELLTDGQLSFSMLSVVCEAVPGHRRAALLLAEQWLNRGVPERARILVSRFRTDTIDDRQLLRLQVRLHRALGELDAVHKLLNAVPPDASDALKIDVHWTRAGLYEDEKNTAGEVDELRALWTLYRESVTAVVGRRFAGALQRNGELEEALEVIRSIAESDEAAKDDQWFLAELGTALEQWDGVRDAAERLEIPVSESTPPVCNLGPCALRLPDGRQVTGHRIGLCHAEMRQITLEEPEQLYAIWAYDPFTLDRSDPERPSYQASRCLKPSPFVGCDVDGCALGEAQEQRLFDAVTAVDGVVYRSSSDEYRITDPTTGKTVAAMYYRVAIPPEQRPWTPLLNVLRELDEELDGPLVWTRLGVLLGDEAGAREHAAIAEQWGM